jgi:alpha-beta hydrolase superfamily lysophospholipase
VGNATLRGPHRLDRPEIRSRLFHPRADHGACPAGARDLHLPVGAGVSLGARLFSGRPEAPTLLFFHGNGEIVADYDDVGPHFAYAGINFLAVDYRGYGRSEGLPSAGTLLTDARAAWEGVREWLTTQRYAGPLLVGGRSLGSAPALELAAAFGTQGVAGLLVESGFARTMLLMRVLGIDPEALGLDEADGFGNLDKIRGWGGPVLVIHGGRDRLIPPQEGRDLFAAAGSRDKRLLVIPQADHNSVLAFGLDAYLEGVAGLGRSAFGQR